MNITLVQISMNLCHMVHVQSLRLHQFQGLLCLIDAFQTIINMGGELKNPRKNIVRGVLISMLITAAIYIMFAGYIYRGCGAKHASQSRLAWY